MRNVLKHQPYFAQALSLAAFTLLVFVAGLILAQFGVDIMSSRNFSIVFVVVFVVTGLSHIEDFPRAGMRFLQAENLYFGLRQGVYFGLFLTAVIQLWPETDVQPDPSPDSIAGWLLVFVFCGSFYALWMMVLGRGQEKDAQDSLWSREIHLSLAHWGAAVLPIIALFLSAAAGYPLMRSLLNAAIFYLIGAWPVQRWLGPDQRKGILAYRCAVAALILCACVVEYFGVF